MKKKSIMKIVILSSILLCSTIIICGIASDVRTNTNLESTVVTEDEALKHRLVQESDLNRICRNYDKIDNTYVKILSDDNTVNILLELNEKLSDSETDNLISSVLSIVKNDNDSRIVIKDLHGNFIYSNV